MGRKGRRRLRALVDELAQGHPGLESAEERIRAGHVLVDGRVVANPASLVPVGASLVLRGPVPLRGEAKLRAALEAFAIRVAGRVALDVGAAAGGFTRVLLAAGVRRVYAVDAGHGQLLGSLRRDPRVVSLEATNLGQLDRSLVPEPVEVVTVDLSYLALHHAVPQLARVQLAAGADAVALVKPQFELGLAAPPADPGGAVEPACAGFEACGWTVVDVIESPVRGSRGAREFLLHARRGPNTLDA